MAIIGKYWEYTQHFQTNPHSPGQNSSVVNQVSEWSPQSAVSMTNQVSDVGKIIVLRDFPLMDDDSPHNVKASNNRRKMLNQEKHIISLPTYPVIFPSYLHYSPTTAMRQ